MYRFITTCSVECYWHMHMKQYITYTDETMNVFGFKCATNL